MKYVPTLESEVPIDMTDRRIAVDLEVPDTLIASGPGNGCQVFVKDDQFRSQYGRWRNCTQRGLVQIHLQPSTISPPDGLTDPSFDPRRVRTIGVKLGTNDQSRHGVRFAGRASW